MKVSKPESVTMSGRRTILELPFDIPSATTPFMLLFLGLLCLPTDKAWHAVQLGFGVAGLAWVSVPLYLIYR